MPSNDQENQMARSERREWGADTQVNDSVVPSRSGRRRVVATASSIALAWSFLLSVAAPSAAAPGTLIDVQPEVAEVQAGSSVTLTAFLRDAEGNPAVGAGSSTHVRWYFGTGSPNDTTTGNSSHDFECFTGDIGRCSITYTA